MKTKLFSILDSKAETYTQPMCQPTFGVAERIFADEARNPESQISKHPEDYTLFYLGEMDLSTGIIETEATPKAICKAINFKGEL